MKFCQKWTYEGSVCTLSLTEGTALFSSARGKKRIPPALPAAGPLFEIFPLWVAISYFASENNIFLLTLLIRVITLHKQIAHVPCDAANIFNSIA